MTTIFDLIDSGDDEAALRCLRDDPPAAASRHESGVTPVLYAMYANRSALAHALAGAAGIDLDLAEVAAIDDAAGTRARLDAGAPVDARTPDGFTPLQLAADFGALGSAAALIAAGADVDAVSDNPMRIQPLHAAAAGRHGDVAALLIAAGAELDGKQRHGWTPLQSAAHNGDVTLLRALVVAGADVTATNDDGHTAAVIAAEAGHHDLVAELAG